MAVEVAEAVVMLMLLRELTLLQVGGARYFLPGWVGPCHLPLLRMHPEPILTHLRVPVPRLQSNLLIFHSQVYPQDTLPCPGHSLSPGLKLLRTCARGISGHPRSWCLFTAWCRRSAWEDLDGDDIPRPPQDTD